MKQLPIIVLLLFVLTLGLLACQSAAQDDNQADTTAHDSTDGYKSGIGYETHDRTLVTFANTDIALSDVPQPVEEEMEAEKTRSAQMLAPIYENNVIEGYTFTDRLENQTQWAEPIVCRVGDFIGPALWTHNEALDKTVELSMKTSNEKLTLVTNGLHHEMTDFKIEAKFKAVEAGVTVLAVYATCHELEACDVIYYPVYILE